MLIRDNILLWLVLVVVVVVVVAVVVGVGVGGCAETRVELSSRRPRPSSYKSRFLLQQSPQ